MNDEILTSLSSTIEKLNEKSHVNCFVSGCLELLNTYFKMIKELPDDSEEANFDNMNP